MKRTIVLSDKAEKGLAYIASNAGSTPDDYIEPRVNQLLEGAADAIPLTEKQVAAIEAIKLADDVAADAAKAAVEAR